MPRIDVLNDENKRVIYYTRNCVTCNYKAINGIEYPCVACSQNLKHENAEDMWEG